MKKFLHYIFICCSIISDVFFIGFAFVLGYWIRFYSPAFLEIFPLDKGIPPFEFYQRILPVFAFVWLVVLTYAGFYRLKFLSAFDELLLVIKGVSLASLFVLALTFFYRSFTYSRLVIIIDWLLALIFIYISKELLKFIYQFCVQKWGEGRRILIVGKGKVAKILQNKLDYQRNWQTYTIENVDKVGLNKILSEKEINEVILASPSLERKKILELSLLCEENGVKFKFVPDLLEFYLGEININEYFDLPLLSLKSASLHGTNFYVKRILDVISGVILISFFFPVLVLLALLIKLESQGSVFYLQPRVGYRSKQFLFFKFRTMVVNADKILNEIRHLSERNGPVFKMKRDPRITSMGKFLRRYSLDELPQLINVLRGEMSLVGPRPQVVWEAAHNDNIAKRRLRVVPGITGLWQVSGRSELSYDDMIQLDIYYLENWNIALDLKILLKTIPVVLSGKGAY